MGAEEGFGTTWNAAGHRVEKQAGGSPLIFSCSGQNWYSTSFLFCVGFFLYDFREHFLPNCGSCQLMQVWKKGEKGTVKWWL